MRANVKSCPRRIVPGTAGCGPVGMSGPGVAGLGSGLGTGGSGAGPGPGGTGEGGCGVGPGVGAGGAGAGAAAVIGRVERIAAVSCMTGQYPLRRRANVIRADRIRDVALVFTSSHDG
jgi:hypothetical protein